MPVIRLLPILVLVACTGGDEPEETGVESLEETGQPETGWFVPADLSPRFEHSNALWAGTALLDYDDDGWLDIFLTNGHSHPDALYRNLGDGRFEDVASDAGLDSTALHGAAVAGDLDNDGDTDLVIAVECTVGTLNEEGLALADGGFEVYLNDGEGHFQGHVLSLPGTFETGHCPVSMELADFNSDGVLDLVAANGLDQDQAFPWVYRKEVREAVDFILLGNGAGSFEERLDIMEIPGGTGTGGEVEDELAFQFVSFMSVIMDVNQDGRMDRIAGFGGGPLQLYLQLEDGGLSISSGVWTAAVGEGLWMGAAVADLDGDGWLDLYLTNQGLSPLLLGYDNIPDGSAAGGDNDTLEVQSRDDGPIVGTINPFHSVVTNREGHLFEDWEWTLSADHLLAGDLFDGMPDRETGELKYPRWVDPPDLARLPWAWGVVALDANADGWPDVAFTGNNCAAPMDIIWDEEHGAGPGGLLINQGGVGFADYTWEAGVENVDAWGRYQDGRGLAVGDLNNDGFPDLVYANRTYNPSQSDPNAQVPGFPRVLLHKGLDRNWLQVKLVGTTSNRDALGAIVYVDDGNYRRAHAYGMGGGTNSSSERLLTIGLMDIEEVDIEVVFPSGATVAIPGVEANQRIVVEEE